jgi:hypothetical protein
MSRSKTIVLRSNFDVSECLRRIREVADEASWTPFSWSGYEGSKDLLLRSDGQDVTIWKRIYYRNDFRPYFYGRLNPETQGARLEGRFNMSLWARTFMTIWLGFVAIASVPALMVFFRDSNLPLNRRLFDLIPVGMFAFGLLLLKFGVWLGKNQERFILDSLQTALSAHVEILEEGSRPPGLPENRPL